MSASWKGHDPVPGRRRKICPLDDQPCTGQGLVPYDTCRADCAQARFAMMVSGDIPKPRRVINPDSVRPTPWLMLVMIAASSAAIVLLVTT